MRHRMFGKGSVDRMPVRSAMILMSIAVFLAFLAGCADSNEKKVVAPSSPGQAPAQADPVSQMFLTNRANLNGPDERVKTALSANIGGFTTPMGGSQSQTVTIDFGVRNQDPSGSLVVLAMIPYQVGDPAQSAGAKFFPVGNSAFSLGPGESRSVSIELIRERFAQSSSPQPATPGGAPSARPSDSTQPGANAGGPFDAASGLQILFVVQFAGVVSAESWREVALVPDSDFQRRYGAYMGYQYGIGVPVNQIA